MSAARGLEERFTSHQGRRLRYLVGGSGLHMLLCHGFIGSAENFAEWFGELLPRRTLIVPDLPGFGESMHLDGRHHAAVLAEAALAAARDAGAYEYDVGGLCLGAGVAFAVQRLRPAATRRLVLHTPLLAPHVVRKSFHVQVRVMTAPGVFPLMTWLSRRRIVSDAYKRIFVEGSNVDAGAAQANFDNQLRAHPRAAREWLLEGLRRDDAAALRSGSHRVLILVAADDRIVNVRRMIAAAGLGGQTRVAVIEEAGHGWTEASVRRQLEVITAFLDDRPLPDRSGVAA